MGLWVLFHSLRQPQMWESKLRRDSLSSPRVARSACRSSLTAETPDKAGRHFRTLLLNTSLPLAWGNSAEAGKGNRTLQCSRGDACGVPSESCCISLAKHRWIEQQLATVFLLLLQFSITQILRHEATKSVANLLLAKELDGRALARFGGKKKKRASRKQQTMAAAPKKKHEGRLFAPY
ncbi:hypothetical protein, conserved in T. vivax [Trypanosoma vivax Y486]|uniref:Uncharacterized protein n=1 Tax=Trypanosoma vivax (strain Y486) TaxID=1055687 RepID=F9WVI2_TRYVY|nr:hypothetical protein, conserved in T. vivax [Trypanosoma vivax Y486]|eukprot:CCD21590.1 hypothetical protein, conserved in T. vivax [Trypanosoma vivax Y486]